MSRRFAATLTRNDGAYSTPRVRIGAAGSTDNSVLPIRGRAFTTIVFID